MLYFACYMRTLVETVCWFPAYCISAFWLSEMLCYICCATVAQGLSGEAHFQEAKDKTAGTVSAVVSACAMMS